MKMKLFKTILASIFLGASCLSLSGCFVLSGLLFDDNTQEEEETESSEVQTQLSSSECIGKNYETIIETFEKSGFKNFRLNFLGDIILGLFAKENDVDSIRINEAKSFYKDTVFDAKSVVFIDIHSRDESQRIITGEVDGELPILYTSQYFRSRDKSYTGEQLSNIGFTNVAYNPIQDCYSAYDYEYNDTDIFTVNGSSQFNDYSFFAKDADIRVAYHTIPGDYCTNGLEHTLANSPIVEPTCTEPGWTSGTYCIVCVKTFDGRVEIPPKGHTKVVDIEAIEPTCISTGLTESSHCSECHEILSEQTEIPIDPSHHANVDVIEGKKATCISEGISDKIICRDCETIVQEHETLPINPNYHEHTTTTSGVRPSNGRDGYTGKTTCDDCGLTITPSYSIPWSGSPEEAEATQALQEAFPVSLAKKVVITGICNSFSSDVFDSTGNYYIESKLHNYSYASQYYNITGQGTWKWAGTNKWRFENFTLYSKQYSSTYHLYGYVYYDSTRYHLRNVTNGKTGGQTAYYGGDDELPFNFLKTLVQ